MALGQGFLGPDDKGVNDVVELGQFAGLIEVADPSERVRAP